MATAGWIASDSSGIHLVAAAAGNRQATPVGRENRAVRNHFAHSQAIRLVAGQGREQPDTPLRVADRQHLAVGREGEVAVRTAVEAVELLARGVPPADRPFRAGRDNPPPVRQTGDRQQAALVARPRGHLLAGRRGPQLGC